MTQKHKWLAGIAGVLIVGGIAVAFFDWNLLKPYVERKVTAATGRTFAINGDLDVSLSLTPVVVGGDGPRMTSTAATVTGYAPRVLVEEDGTLLGRWFHG